MTGAETPSDLLAFWFSDDAEPFWFKRDDAFDATLRARFGALWAAQAETGGEPTDDPEARLAQILLFDQVPRNVWRDDPRAFATDGLGRALTYAALAAGDDLFFKAERPDAWRAFLYMPLMHSEDLADQRRCVDLFATHGPAMNLDYARRHHDIVARFGRFPHRNAVLGRYSTTDERLFLANPGTGF